MILNDDKITSSTASGISIDKVLAFDGTPQSPGISFFNDPSSGLYRINQGVLGISIGGNRVGQIDINGIQTSQPYWNIVDQKNSGVTGGNSVAAIWTRRNLNTTIGINTIIGSSIASDTITLPPGTYRIFVSSILFGSNTKIRLRNITDSLTILVGTSVSSTSSQTASNVNNLSGVFIISGIKNLELQYYSTGALTNGLGIATSSGEPEIYTQLELWKVG
jgi:hypothetical protein